MKRVGLDDAPFSELMREHYGTTAARMAESLGGESESVSDDLIPQPRRDRRG